MNPDTTNNRLAVIAIMLAVTLALVITLSGRLWQLADKLDACTEQKGGPPNEPGHT